MAAGKKTTPSQPRKLTARQKAKAQRDVGRRISEARLAAGLSQRAVAAAVRLSPSVVSRVERGLRPLDPLELARFARLFETTLADLVR